MRYIVPLLLLMLHSCGGDGANMESNDVIVKDSVKVGLDEALKASEKKEKPAMDSVDFNKSVKKIEAKYGEQWDFCNCVVKGDSINKAFMKPNIPDKEFDRLSKRFDEIDEKCQAFRIQDADRTPEERALHEKKVRRCLREAGIKQ